MVKFYTFLVSSLPALLFGMKPPFSYERFLEICKPLIPREDFLLLSTLPITIDEYSKGIRHPMVEKWLAFDTMLRNELVKIRAYKMKIDESKYMRGKTPIDMTIYQTAILSTKSTSILEAEKILDEARWQALDDLCFGHYFDIDYLILYAYKLKILERWERIHSQDKERLTIVYTEWTTGETITQPGSATG
ncbi:MAG: DUF2764 family protein [Thermodesulfovibrionales bacterium]